MKNDTINKIVLLLLVITISAIFLAMIRGFLMPIFMAGLFSAMASPFHRWLSARLGGRETVASALTVGFIVILILGPLSILISVVVAQAVSVGQSVTPFVQSLIKEPTTFSNVIEKIPYYEQILPYRDIILEKAGQAVANISTFLINSLQSVTLLTVNAIFGSIIMLYVMFYFLVMGDKLLVKILYFLPLRDDDEQRLLMRFTSVTRATLKGTMIIGLMQGFICGVAFAIAGIKGPVFWGTLMAVTSVIPAFGTAIVWGPALLVLLLLGDFVGAGILLVLCGGVAGNLDNLVRPRLVGKDTEMHDLYILFSTLGGISMFGILGIIIGPIIAALFLTIWEIYGKAFKDYLPSVEIAFGPTARSSPKQGPGEDRNETEQEPPQSGGR